MSQQSSRYCLCNWPAFSIQPEDGSIRVFKVYIISLTRRVKKAGPVVRTNIRGGGRFTGNIVSIADNLAVVVDELVQLPPRPRAPRSILSLPPDESKMQACEIKGSSDSGAL